MRGMPADPPPSPRRPRRVVLAIGCTLLVCLLALLCRGPLGPRYWAWQLAHSDADAARGHWLALLVEAGRDARWAADALRDHRRADVRQYGVLVAQTVPAEWATDMLFDALCDPDDGVRHLAAVALSARGDEVVQPLWRIWLKQEGAPAIAACEALARRGTPVAVAALERMSGVARAPELAAALVDALDWIGMLDCVPPFLRYLDDDRPCGGPTFRDRAAGEAVDVLRARGFADVGAAPADGASAPATVAERAAVTLGRITGLRPAFSSTDGPETRAAARAVWSEWRRQATRSVEGR